MKAQIRTLRIRKLLLLRNTISAKRLLDAIERADAWSFTSRPQDLQEVVDFWLDEGRIGTRIELMRNSIDRRLTERSQDRAEARPLSKDRARQGARLRNEGGPGIQCQLCQRAHCIPALQRRRCRSECLPLTIQRFRRKVADQNHQNLGARL